MFIGHCPEELRDISERAGVICNGELVATIHSDEADRILSPIRIATCLASDSRGMLALRPILFQAWQMN